MVEYLTSCQILERVNNQAKTEAWHITNIKLRIRDRKFKVLAAVGGETSVLVSEPNVLSPLFSKGYSIGLN